MDIFRLGVRDIFGIVLPGAILLFVIIYVFWTLPATLGLPALDVSLLKDQGFLSSIAFFVASYVLGYLLRLGTADQVDEESIQALHGVDARDSPSIAGKRFFLVCKEKGQDAKPPCNPETIRSTSSEDR